MKENNANDNFSVCVYDLCVNDVLCYLKPLYVPWRRRSFQSSHIRRESVELFKIGIQPTPTMKSSKDDYIFYTCVWNCVYQTFPSQFVDVRNCFDICRHLACVSAFFVQLFHLTSFPTHILFSSPFFFEKHLDFSTRFGLVRIFLLFIFRQSFFLFARLDLWMGLWHVNTLVVLFILTAAVNFCPFSFVEYEFFGKQEDTSRLVSDRLTAYLMLNSTKDIVSIYSVMPMFGI